jgi:outer membrane murein-binding lipoprotein Lpp
LNRAIIIASLLLAACADEAPKTNQTDTNQGEKLLELQSRIENLETENSKLKEAQSVLAGHIMAPKPKLPSLPQTDSAQREKEATAEYNRLILERRIKELEAAH